MHVNFKKHKKKNVWQTILFKAGAVALILIAILLIISDVKIYQKKRQLTLQIENLKAKIQDLETKNISLKDGIERSDDNQYIEEVAREELDLQKPGEAVVSFVTAEKEPEQDNEKKKNFFQIWLEKLGSIFK